MATTEMTAARPLPAWNFWGETLRATVLLGKREIRTVLRTPAYLIPNLMVPIFFYFVMVGSLEEFATRSGIENWQAFQVPVGILFAVQSGSAGLNMVADIESGYFDKLLLTPANRLAILIGAMGADFFRIMLQGAIVLAVAVPAGLHFETGLPGMVAMILILSVWGLAFSAIGFAVALKTGNSQATQSIWTLFIPLMFLTTAFAPLEALSGWLKVAATLNPMTYVLKGMRSLSMQGWDTGALSEAILAVVVFGALTMTMAFLSMRGRVK
ncbi:MAG TPA: ABC transporter permease [Dehalococcoidia bacterium]|nr:ABC transporter permease [Dehalococcoidia bacterium]